MTKYAFTAIAATAALALIAATPAFAGKAGGFDPATAIAKQGVAVDQQILAQQWAGQVRELQPTVSVASLTGLASDPAGAVHAGRFAATPVKGGAPAGSWLAGVAGGSKVN